MPAKMLSFRAVKVDRFGMLCAQRDRALLSLAPVEAEIKALEGEIRGWFDDAPPEHVETVRGKLYAVTIGARKLKRTVDTGAAIAKLGWDVFRQHATIALKVLDALIPAGEQAGIVASERSGDRSVSDPTLLAPPSVGKRAGA